MAKKTEVSVQGPKYSLIKTKFDLEVAKKNYQLLLQNLSATKVTRDNVNEDLTKDGREILKILEDVKDQESADPLQWHRDIMAIFNSLKDPIKEQVERISGEKKVVATAIQQENALQLAQQKRINDAKQAIIDFSNKVANMISVATTDIDIVEIEKKIGSEKTKTTVYHDLIEDLKAKCDELRPAVAAQKANIRKLQELREQEAKAIETGDVQAQTDIMAKKEHLETIVQETSIRIHEQAYQQATTVDIIAPEIVDTAPKGRSNWKWKIEDIHLLQKKMPHLVKLVPDEDAINALLTTKRLDGSLKDKMEEKWFGVLFYNDKTYTK